MNGHTSAPRRPDREPTIAEVEGLTALGLFRRRVERSRARPMLHAREATFTAGEIDDLSSAAAAALQQRGVRPGDRVALLLQNDPQFPIAQLGAWKAGAITVPLNPMLRERELSRQMADAGCCTLVCLDQLAGHAVPAARAAGVEHVAIASADGVLHAAAGPGGNDEPFASWLSTGGLAPVQVSPKDIAVITFTSGTTGAAKGACSSHANLVWSAHVFRDWVELTEGTVVLGAAPLFHVTGQVGHLAVADLLGAPLILDHRFDARRQLALARQYEATFLVAAVTAFRALMDVGEPAPPTLRALVTGAQAVGPAFVADVERWSGAYVQNIYGMTETTSPSHAVPPGQRAPVHAETGALSIGIPVTGTDSLVVDPDTGEPLPPGSAGEIVIRGPQVVRGYWGRPDADAESFRDGWLRSGDLGVVDEQGWFYVIDRIKDLINVSGFKVAPREVEEVLLEHPDVADAAVVGEDDAYRGETIRAYVVPRPSGTIDVAELERHCRATLAAYKCPRSFTTVDELPRTASGKVMRRALRSEA